MKKQRFLVIIFSFLTLISCTSTRITNTWRNPNKEIHIHNLSKVLVVALFNDETNRRKAEDEMVGYLNGKGIPSYSYFTNTISTKDEATIRAKIKADGFDGAVTMRLVDIDKEKEYLPDDNGFYPNINSSFSGYFFRNWTIFSDPGYYSTTKTYIVETYVYSIKEDNIIWSGLTETSNPAGVQRMTEEIGRAVFKKMKKEGFIKH
jgi:hypothetical protein